MNRIFAAIGLLIAMETGVSATTLASGPLFAGPNQTAADCVLFNAGNGPVYLNGQIIIQNGGAVSLLPSPYTNCGTALAAGGICGFAANINNNIEYACKVIITPDGAEVRGVFEIRDGISTGAVLQNTPLR